MTDYIDNFKNKSVEQRKHLSSGVISRFPDRVCVLVERDKQCKNIPKIIKHKYLVPLNTSVGTFSNILRSKIEIPDFQSFYITFNNTIVSRHLHMIDVYKLYSEEDGFIYCRYCSEQTFG